VSDVRTYDASCHCGAVGFRFRSEPIGSGLRCNCSICIRRGAVVSARYYPPEAFEKVEGLDCLTLYQFGDHDVNHWFCRRCGIYTFHDATAKPGHYRINLGCVSELAVLSLPIELIDGRAF